MDKVASPAGIARSLTTRMNRKISLTDGGKPPSNIGRAFSMKKQEKILYRPEISLPIALISATNPLVYSAPDIKPQGGLVGASSSAPNQLNSVPSSVSLRSERSIPALSSAASTTFTFSGLSTPTDEIPEQQVEDLQSRLQALPELETEQEKASFSSPAEVNTASPTAPAVPKRAPSHTKRTHQVLARQRSLSRVRPDSNVSSAANDEPNRKSTSSSRHQSTHAPKESVVIRSSADMFSARTHLNGSDLIDADHPFGAELAQLTEIAEEFAPRKERAETCDIFQARASQDSDRSEDKLSMPATPKTPVPVKPVIRIKRHEEPTIWDEEQNYLAKHGLNIFSAEDYMAEIGSPYESVPALAF